MTPGDGLGCGVGGSGIGTAGVSELEKVVKVRGLGVVKSLNAAEDVNE